MVGCNSGYRTLEVMPPQPDDTHEVDFRIVSFLQQHAALILVCALILMILLLIVTIVILMHRGQNCDCAINSQDQIFNTKEPPNKTLKPETSTKSQGPDPFEIVSRQQWLADPPKHPPRPLPSPVPYVSILHTGTENCYTPAQCVLAVRFIQTFHMENYNWNDIGYSFLSGGDGRAYEGQGWTAAGPPTLEYANESIRIAFVGIFNTSEPSERQKSACRRVIQRGVEMGYIGKDYKLVAARHLRKVQGAEEGGRTLYDELRGWGHWSS